MGFIGVWFFLRVVAGIANIPRGTYGACLHQGSLFANYASWKPDSCQDCRCQADIVMCRTTRCPMVQCDFHKGERLRVPPGECCPECVPQSQGSCLQEGTIYEHDSQWSGSNCSICTCTQGTVSCIARPCAPLNCGGDERLTTHVGQCCPECGRNGASCSVEGLEYSDGEEWHPTACTKCVCSAGETQCSAVHCQPVVCQLHENLVIRWGSCCPQCVPISCQVSGNEYKHGQAWWGPNCSSCYCDQGQAQCRTETCPNGTCEKGQRNVQGAGQCCEECASSRGTCLHDGVPHYHGDTWNVGCQFCACEQGQVLCQQVECGRVECTGGEELVHLPGKCCPECKVMNRPCVYNNQSKENLEKWQEGACRQCVCRDSQVTCYQRLCPTCPVGTLVVPVEGMCCPKCQDVQCHRDCLTCSQTPDQCNSCKDPQSVLHNSHCLQTCPSGFFKKGRVCAACKVSCGSCENDFECTSCGAALLMSNGQCVSTCESGFFASHSRCARCHDSCSTCRGPGQQDCLSCSDPAHLLNDGLCIPECGLGFYARQGTCHACDKSCMSCYPDNPSCVSCPPDTALHHGKCVSHCLEKHYRDSYGRCRECHFSCAACLGPSMSQCTLCPGTLVLHLGQCQDSCGEGLYSQDGVCKSCHRSCRSCVGPRRSDCTLCQVPEEALFPQSSGAIHGICTSGCKDHFFLEPEKYCRECHASCLQCTGSSSMNCTSCSSPSVLHQGQCLRRCPQGYHNQDNICNACHPSCQECSGRSEVDCSACPPHASLHEGQCWTNCPEGHYLNTEGHCIECQAGCQQCVASPDQGSICLKCVGLRDLLLGDHCVPHCPMGSYARNGVCIKCHSSCESCIDKGPLSCTSCTEPLVLSPTGLCVVQCLIGYYADENRVCQACDSQCLTCDKAGVCTSCRDPAKVLLFGQCQHESCGQHYYLNLTTHSCTECDWSCVACGGPLRSDCLECKEGYILQDGACTQGCSVGSYQDGERCLSCDERCAECQGPGHCLRCERPFTLLKGLCVHDCGKHFFMDTSNQHCTACPPDCVECGGPENCTVCSRNTFLKSGLCTEDCGPGYFASNRSRACQVNSHSPVLRASSLMLVETGGTTPLNLSIVTTEDSDSSSQDLTLQLVLPPSNGQLIVLMDGKERTLNREDTFTFRELRSQAVRFIHSREKSKSGQLILRAVDPHFVSPPVTVNIRAVSQQPPYVLCNRPLEVTSGGNVAITKLVLWVEDDDNPQEVLVTVLDPPLHGQLTYIHGDRPLRTFGMEELAREQVRYVHDGSSYAHDRASLLFGDGHNHLSLLLHVNIAQETGRSPRLLSSSIAWVRQGGMVQISQSHLRAESRGCNQSQILFTIVPSQRNPKYGKVVLLSPMPAGEYTDERQGLADEEGDRSAASFTQQDVDEGNVWYQHSGVGTRRDSLLFQVSIEGFQDTFSDVHAFVIGVLPPSPGIDLITPDSELQITAPRDHMTTIWPSALSFVSNDLPNEKMIYNITRPLAQGQGIIKHQYRPYSPVNVFTQADINDGKISYWPPPAPSNLEEMYQFSFTVSDGVHTTSEMEFNIHLLANQQPSNFRNAQPMLQVHLGSRAPVGDTFTFNDITQNTQRYGRVGGSTEEDSGTFSMTDSTSVEETVQVLPQGSRGDGPRLYPGARLSMEVPEKSSSILTRAHLAYLDDDSPDENIRIQLVTVPVYGVLTRTTSALDVEELRELSTFTMEDINHHRIRYTSLSETGSQGVMDVFHFTIYNERNESLDNQRCIITITPKPKQPPTVAMHRKLKVQEGGRVQLSASKIAVRHSDTPMVDCLVWLASPPKYGFIENTGAAGNSDTAQVISPEVPFCIEDLVSDHVFYVQNVSLSAAYNQEELSFYFSDGSRQIEVYIFNIDIQRKTNGTPVISGNNTFKEENSITNSSLTMMDLDNLGSELPLKATEKPSYEVLNRGLVMHENSVKKISALQLSVQRQDGTSRDLEYHITKQPQLGHLEHISSPGTRISSFTQDDLMSGRIRYIHTSDKESLSDAFTFTVSDGANEISQMFHIAMRPVDDSLPVLQVQGMSVQQGVRKMISEFELKATDADTEEGSIIFRVIQAPRHGSIQKMAEDQGYHQANDFTMEDVYRGRVSYSHDGSKSLVDHLALTVTDGTNHLFVVEEAGKEIVTAAPQKFNIDILPLNDGTPHIVTNLGLHWLEYMDNKTCNLITKEELLTVDPDTDDKQLVYDVTTGPRHGFLETKLRPDSPISTFSQADINQGLIRYVLNEENAQETMDNFTFIVKDSKLNAVTDIFHIQWSLISFEHPSYNVSETAGTVAVTMKRTGNLSHNATVLCHTEEGTATSTSSSRPGQQDYGAYSGQVQFDEGEDIKVCIIVINDDQTFENAESFTVSLNSPVHSLLGTVTQAEVNIFDPEDEPTLQFSRKTHHVDESAGILFAPIERKGDVSTMVSVLCHTVPKTAHSSGLVPPEPSADYVTRGLSEESRVVFEPGVTVSMCDVKLIDDSEYEPPEEFELVLTEASDNTRIGDVAITSVVIEGPNDASVVFLGSDSFTHSEDAGTIEIPVLRRGSDLSSVSSVWCATRPSSPPSATPGTDYIPSSKKVEFKPGVTEETCSLTIMDDIQNPTIEGLESFVVFLSSAQGALLTEPFEASVIITDTSLDIPSMQFEKNVYSVKEKDGILHIPIIRTGDLTVFSSIRCYTQTTSATTVNDFVEKRNTDESRIIFRRGENVKNCSIQIIDDSVYEPEELFQVHLGTPLGDHWSGAVVGKNDVATIIITNDEDAPTIEFEEANYRVREPPGPNGMEVLSVKVIRRGDHNRTSKVRCSTRDGSARAGVDYSPKSRVLKFNPGVDHVLFKVEILSNEAREWHESFSLVLGPDEPVEAVLGEITIATVTITNQESAGILSLPAPPIVVSLSEYDHVEEATKEGSRKPPSPGYPLVCVTPCDTHYPSYPLLRARCEGAGINQSSVRFGWEVAAPIDPNGARSPFEMVTDNTPFTSVNQMVLDSIYFSRRFRVRCVAQALDKTGHLSTPLRSSAVTIGTESSICHTPIAAGTARGFQAQSFIATLKYLDVKHKENPNRIHISVQIPHQDGMLPLVSTMPLQNLHFLLSESIYRQQHICSNLVTLKDLQGISETGFLDDVPSDSLSLGPGYDRPYQFSPGVREPKTIQLYKHLNLKSCLWTFDAYYDMTELIDVCGGSVTADFQVRDSAQSFLTVQVPLYVSYIYVTAPRGWASLEHHTEMEFSFFYDTVLWRTGIQTDTVLSARLQISRIYIREDGRLVVEFKTHAKFRGQFVPDHPTLPGHKSHLVAPDHLGGMQFDLQLLWSAQTFDSPFQLWKATSSYSRKDYSGEYTVFLVPCTVQPSQPWVDPGDKPLPCTAHTPEKFLVPIAFQQTNRPVPVVYSLNTEFQLCNSEKAFLMNPASADVSMAEMDYKGAFSIGQTLYGRVLWNPEQNLNTAYKVQLEKVFLCTGQDGYVPFFDPTGTLYNEGPQYGCIQPNKNLRHRFLLLDRKQPEVCDKYFQDVPFEAGFASDSDNLQSMTLMPGVDGFTMKVDALYKVEAGHQWYLQVIYVIGPESSSGSRVRRSLTHRLRRNYRDLTERTGRLVLDESLIYDNEGDQVKNGTNMKTLKLEVESEATFDPHTGGSIGGGMAALAVVLVVLIATCFLVKKCRMKKHSPAYLTEEYPLNTKVEVCLEKNFSSMHCTVRKVNILNMNHDASKVKVKQVNLEVKLHNNFNEGTEV